MRSGKIVVGSLVLPICLISFVAIAQPVQGPPPGQPISGAAAGVLPLQTQPQAASAAAAAQDEGYILGAEDVVQVEVLGRSDFNVKSKIGTDGKIQLPLLGAVDAANRTVLQLRNEIRVALQKGGFFTQPIVEVQVASYASRYVTVLGAVGTPGLVPVDRPYRLSEILARVGGVRENGADYLTVRTKTGERNYAIKDLATGNESLDPYVQPGDKIYSPNADIFYIQGQVKAPGNFRLTPKMTLSMALARAGGITDLGSSSSIKIIRNNTEMKVRDLNSEIQPNDIIDVGEGWF
jgi:polysaccharide export outer membrane protein